MLNSVLNENIRTSMSTIHIYGVHTDPTIQDMYYTPYEYVLDEYVHCTVPEIVNVNRERNHAKYLITSDTPYFKNGDSCAIKNLKQKSNLALRFGCNYSTFGKFTV